jgi:uncharacterized protein
LLPFEFMPRSRVRLRSFRLALAFSLLAAVCSFAIDLNNLPKPTGYVSDLAHVVDQGSKEQLERFCTAVEEQLGVQFSLVTIESLDDRPIRDVALEIARKWGVGDKKSNQGVLLLLAVKDRKSDIETGRGIEPYLTDGFSGSTLRSMRPDLRAGNYGAALIAAAQEMANQIAQGKGISFSGNLPERRPVPRDRSGGSGGLPFPLIILGIFVLLWLFGRGGRRGGGGRYGGGAGNFLTGMLIGNMLGGRRGGGSDWGSGGGFGGGSGGGGGFGGFGGGDFGGGGASSDW